MSKNRIIETTLEYFIIKVKITYKQKNKLFKFHFNITTIYL